MNPTQLFSDVTKDHLRIAFEESRAAPATFDPRVRVMLSLRFRPEWVVEWFPKIPLKRAKCYFDGEQIKPEHIEAMTEAAWRVVMAAQELLLDMSLADHSMVTNPKWLAFSRRIYDCGVMLDALGDAPC